MSWDMYDMTQKVQVVVVAIVLPLVILAASLWHDWVEEGQSPRARKIMKDWEWNIDEMAHAVNVKGRLIGYRVLQAGVIIYLGYSRFFRDYRSIELSVLAIVSIVAEVLFIIIKTIRNMAGDEDKTQMWKQMGHSVFNNLMYLCIVVDVFWMWGGAPMFTAETGIGVVVMVVFAAFWLAFMLWEDWGQAGKTARARASAKANGWEQDEMQNTITRNGAIIAYRLMTVGLFVVMLVDIIAFGKNVSEFAILWFVCMVFEGVYRTIAIYRAAKDDEENPPSKSALAGDIVKRIFIPVVIFADLIWKFWR